MKQDNTQLSVIVSQKRERKIDTQVQRQIERLQQHCIVELEAVQQFHTWLNNKRHWRQACRVIGDSRTGKIVACDAYRHKHTPQASSGDAPIRAATSANSIMCSVLQRDTRASSGMAGSDDKPMRSASVTAALCMSAMWH